MFAGEGTGARLGTHHQYLRHVHTRTRGQTQPIIGVCTRVNTPAGQQATEGLAVNARTLPMHQLSSVHVYACVAASACDKNDCRFAWPPCGSGAQGLTFACVMRHAGDPRTCSTPVQMRECQFLIANQGLMIMRIPHLQLISGPHNNGNGKPPPKARGAAANEGKSRRCVAPPHPLRPAGRPQAGARLHAVAPRCATAGHHRHSPRAGVCSPALISFIYWRPRQLMDDANKVGTRTV